MKFANVILRLEGMHFLMSFLGFIGNLMADYGLKAILSSAFGGAKKMHSGKNFPQNSVVGKWSWKNCYGHIHSRYYLADDLENFLSKLSIGRKTVKVWVYCLVKPDLLIMLYVLAAREGDCTLHLSAVSKGCFKNQVSCLVKIFAQTVKIKPLPSFIKFTILDVWLSCESTFLPIPNKVFKVGIKKFFTGWLFCICRGILNYFCKGVQFFV